MRLHIALDEALVAELDRRAGKRNRSRFIEASVRRALDDEGRWEAFESAIGSISDTGHAWDKDPAAWVREQRRRPRGEV